SPGAVTNSKIADSAVTGSKFADASITKAKLSSDIFSDKMEDNGGWQVKIDPTILGYNVSNELQVIDDGITEAKLADDAVTSDKILDTAVTLSKLAANSVNESKLVDGAVTENKIANNAITEAKLADGAVTTSKLLNEAVTAVKIGTNAITAVQISPGAVTSEKLDSGSVTLEKIATNVKNTFIYPQSRTLWVSSEYSDNKAPYFDTIQAAIDYAESTSGFDTIKVGPGTYTEAILLNSSLSLIGEDKTKCIIDHVPDSLSPQSIDITGIGGLPIYIKNFTIKAISQNINAVNSVGLRVNGTSGQKVFLSDLWIKAVGKDDNSLPRLGIGLHALDAEIIMTDVYCEGVGGAHTNAGTGANGYGVLLDHANLKLSIQRTDLIGIGGQSTGTNGKGYGIRIARNPTEDMIIEKSTIESTDESIFSDVATTPRVFATEYNIAVNANTQSDNFVNATQDSAIKIQKKI